MDEGSEGEGRWYSARVRPEHGDAERVACAMANWRVDGRVREKKFMATKVNIEDRLQHNANSIVKNPDTRARIVARLLRSRAIRAFVPVVKPNDLILSDTYTWLVRIRLTPKMCRLYPKYEWNTKLQELAKWDLMTPSQIAESIYEQEVALMVAWNGDEADVSEFDMESPRAEQPTTNNQYTPIGNGLRSSKSSPFTSNAVLVNPSPPPHPALHARYLRARCNVRYWEDTYVNGEKDHDGSRIPCREGTPADNNRLGGGVWVPVIDLHEGRIENWPAGTTAKILYKVCDEGLYEWLDADRNVVHSINGYVPRIMCPSKEPDGDIVVMNVGIDGAIENWRNIAPR